LKFYGKYVILNIFIYESFKSKQFLTGMFLSAGMVKNSGWAIAGLAGADSLSVSLSLPFLLFNRPESFYFLLFSFFFHFSISA